MQGSRGHACNSQHDATNSKYARPTLSHTQRLLCLPQEEWDEDEISETSMEDSNGAENFTTSKRQLLVSRTHKARLQEAETQGNTIPEVGDSHCLLQTLALLNMRAGGTRAQHCGPAGLQHLEHIGQQLYQTYPRFYVVRARNSKHDTPSAPPAVVGQEVK